jgi:hypothetical protein
MFKIIISSFVLIFLSAISHSLYAQERAEWEFIEAKDNKTSYLNVDSITYNETDSSIIFFIKNEYAEHSEEQYFDKPITKILTKYKIYCSIKKYAALNQWIYFTDKTSKENHTNEYEDIFKIEPDSFFDRMFNRFCKKK